MQKLYEGLVETFNERKDVLTDQGQISFIPFFMPPYLYKFIGIFNEYLAARRLSLDYYSRLFWATSYASATTTAYFINTPYYVDPFIPHHMYPPLLHQAQTGQIPVAVHFDDHRLKGLRDEWWGSFWWNQLQGEEQRFREIVLSRLERATVNFAGGEQQAWADICPWSMLGI